MKADATTELDAEARLQAQKQWNATACGELEGDKNSIGYFDRVQRDRDDQQPWTDAYFRYGDFAGKNVLEIGTGQGTDAVKFARGGAELYGVDITDNHLALTERNFRLRDLKITLHKADATKLPFADGSMDCVYSFGVMHHIPEIDTVVKEAYRVLKPGGVLMLALYHKWSMHHLISLILANGILKGKFWKIGYAGVLATIEVGADGVNYKPYVRLFSKGETRRLLRGFDIRDISMHQFYPEHASYLRWLFEPFRGARFMERFGWYVVAQAVKPAGHARDS